MRRIAIAALLILFIGVTYTPADSADATSAWDSYAAEYNFATTGEVGVPNATFAQAYSGSNFNSDFGNIMATVAKAMGTAIPPFGGSDVMGTSLNNWPDQ